MFNFLKQKIINGYEQKKVIMKSISENRLINYKKI